MCYKPHISDAGLYGSLLAKDLFGFSFLQCPSLRHLLFYAVIKSATRRKESGADCSQREQSKFRKSSCQNNPELKYY